MLVPGLSFVSCLVHPMAAVGLLRAHKHAGARVLGVAVKVT